MVKVEYEFVGRYMVADKLEAESVKKLFNDDAMIEEIEGLFDINEELDEINFFKNYKDGDLQQIQCQVCMDYISASDVKYVQSNFSNLQTLPTALRFSFHFRDRKTMLQYKKKYLLKVYEKHRRKLLFDMCSCCACDNEATFKFDIAYVKLPIKYKSQHLMNFNDKCKDIAIRHEVHKANIQEEIDDMMLLIGNLNDFMEKEYKIEIPFK